jgi:nucleoside 2-deoxyribosyltransferase
MTATVSGSFRRAMTAVQEAVYVLTDRGVTVLSPADPRVVDHFGDFLFVASDRVHTLRLVQSRHLAAIEASDFLWLVAPDGYVGLSAAMEIGFAVAHGIPVYSVDIPMDLTLRQYVTPVERLEDALGRVAASRRERNEPQILVEPFAVVQSAHDDLDELARELGAPADRTGGEERVTRAATRIRRSLSLLR